MIKTTLLFFIAITITFLPGQNEPYELMPTRVFSEEKHGIYFKSLPFVDANDHYLFLSNNLDHSVWRLDLLSENLERIGQKGVGPGDYYHPMTIATYGKVFALLHNGRISFFNGETKQYLHGFKVFLNVSAQSLALSENSLFLHTPPKKHPFIEHSWKGEKKQEFGEHIKTNPKHHSFESMQQYASFSSFVNQTIIVPYENEKYLINQNLLKIKKYDKNGELIHSLFIKDLGISGYKKINNHIDELAKKWIKKSFPIQPMWIDSAKILDEILFISIHYYCPKNESGIKNGVLLALSLKNNTILNRFDFFAPSRNMIEGFQGFGLRKTIDSYYAYFAMAQISEDEHIIAEYKIDKSMLKNANYL